MSSKWALVTGASSGIGKELAHVLAEHKVNIVLTSRNVNALTTLSTDLRSKYKIKTLVYPCDLSVHDQVMGLVSTIESKKISIEYLINNAGFGDYGYFIDTKWSKESEMINLNIATLTYLTKVYVQHMKASGHGRILNVASVAAFLPGPLMSVYYATKAYVLSFSEAVSEELRGSGVTLTTLCPGPTESNFWVVANKPRIIRLFPWRAPTSRQVATYGYESMMRGDRVAIYGLGNKLIVLLTRFVPRQLISLAIKWGQQI